MFKRIGYIYDHLEELLLVIGIVIMVMVIFLQVVMRYGFNNSLSWSEELARIIFIWASWIGISLGQKKCEHIKITMLTEKLKGTAKVIVLMLADICTLAILMVLLIKGIETTDKIASLASITPALSVPKWVIYAAVPVSTTLMSVRVMKDMVLRVLKKEKEIGEVA